MGRAPCCDKAKVKKGPWSPEEDAQLKEFIEKYGTGGNWIALPQKIGLRRCGKSCRLRWLNYLRPNIKHGDFSDEEDRIICGLFARIGSRWSIIAAQLPGRTDNDIKNYWNTKLKKKLQLGMPPTPQFYQKRPNQGSSCSQLPSSNSLPYSQIASPIECGRTTSLSPSQFRAFTETNIAPSFTTTPLFSPNYISPSQEGGGYSSVLMYGGEASCSSSDGSSFTTHIGHGNLGFHNDENPKFLIAEGDQKAANGCFSAENPTDYTIEDIKQLISSNTVCNNNLNFFLDEIKTEEKALLYY